MTDDLTKRQRDVLRLHGEGKTPTEIGKELGVSSQGVHGHLRRLRGKGLVEGTGRTKARPNEPAAPLTAADALEAVRQAAIAQRRQLLERKATIEKEIAALKREDEEIDAVVTEIDAMVKT